MRPYPTADQKYLMTKSSVMLNGWHCVLSFSYLPIRNANFVDGMDMLGELLVGCPKDGELALATIVKARNTSAHRFPVTTSTGTHAISSLSRPMRPSPVRYSPSRRASEAAIRPKAGVAFRRTQAVK